MANKTKIECPACEVENKKSEILPVDTPEKKTSEVVDKLEIKLIPNLPKDLPADVLEKVKRTGKAPSYFTAERMVEKDGKIYSEVPEE